MAVVFRCSGKPFPRIHELRHHKRSPVQTLRPKRGHAIWVLRHEAGHVGLVGEIVQMHLNGYHNHERRQQRREKKSHSSAEDRDGQALEQRFPASVVDELQRLH